MLNIKQRIGILTGNAFEFYDIAVYAAISPYLTKILEQSGVENALMLVWGIFALRFLARPFGGAVTGWYADVKGQKKALVLTSSLTGIATVLMACLPTNSSWGALLPIFLLILQMIQAFSFGGEYPVAVSYLFKETNKKERAKISAEIVASSIVGVIFSLSLTGSLSLVFSADDMLQFGWRIPLLIGAGNIAISFWFRRKLTDNVRTVREEKSETIQLIKIVKIFLITVPAAVVFYIQSLSGNIVRNILPVGNLQSAFPLLSNLLLFVLLLLTGQVVARWSTPEKMMKIGVYTMILFAIPLYMALGSQNIILIYSSQIVLTIITAMVLANLAAVIFYEAITEKYPTTTLGFGYNISLSLFGGLSPLITASLMPFGNMYVGLYISASGVSFLLAQYLSVMQRK